MDAATASPMRSSLHSKSAVVLERRPESSGLHHLPETVGSYQVIERIAVGGMAEVLKARKHGDHGFEKLVALKKMLPHLAADATSVEMFLDEARITASLEHPHIIQAFELGEDADSLYFAMEYVDGIDVLQLLQDCARAQIRLPATLAALIARDVLDALDYAHEARDAAGRSLAIVHRDVSPSNVLLAWQGHVKLTDFGVALAARRRHQTAQHTLRGKYGYMSPEQVSGGHVDGRSDLFAVGVMLAEMVMARRLFVGPTDLDVLLAVRDVKLDRLDQHAGEFPIELLGIVLRALQATPHDRWQTAGEMRDAIDAWLGRCDRVSSLELAAFLQTVTTAPTAIVDHTSSSIFIRGVQPVIPHGAVTMRPAGLPGVAPPASIDESAPIELSESDALEVLDEDDHVFDMVTTDGLQVEKIEREGRIAATHRNRAKTRPSAVAIDTGEILLLDDLASETVVDDRPTEQDLLAGFELDLVSEMKRAPSPLVIDLVDQIARRPRREKAVTGLVATVPRRKKQHTVETAITSLFEESKILELPRTRAAKGTGRFMTPVADAERLALPPRRARTAEGTPEPHVARARRPSTGIPVLDTDQLPVPPRRATTGNPAFEPVVRPRRRSTTSSVVLSLKEGKLGRLSNLGLGELRNYSDTVEVAPVAKALAPVEHIAEPEVPRLTPSRRLVAQLWTPMGILTLLTMLMVAVFLLAMYGVI